MQPQQRSRFLETVAGLALGADRELSEIALRAYRDMVLVPHGEQAAMGAVNQWLKSGQQRSQWPSVMELLRIIEPPVTERDEANELAGKMIAAISKRGYTWTGLFRYDGHADFPTALLAEFGEHGRDVVMLTGGWVTFCEQFGDLGNTSARAQLRDLIESRSKIVRRDTAVAALEGRKQQALEAGNAQAVQQMVGDLATKLGGPA